MQTGPRERLLTWGVDRLTDRELLALILGTGTRDRPVEQLAGEVLDRLGGLGGVAAASARELAGVDGIGPAQAARISAAISFGRRSLSPSPIDAAVGSAADVYDRLGPRLNELAQEVFIVLALNAKNVVLAEIEVARGCLTGVDVHPREVFRPLIREAAAACVACHNHPSGDPEPSSDDFMLTRRLRGCGELLGIPVLDHVVVARGGYVSIAERLA